MHFRLRCGLGLFVMVGALATGCRTTGPRISAIQTAHLLPEGVDVAAFPEADVVVLRDLAHLQFVNPSRPRAGYELTTEYDIKVLTPSGQSYGRVSVYLGPWKELLEVSGRSYRPGDPESERRLGANSIAYRAAAPAAGTLYDEARIAEFDIPGVEVGDVVELRVKTRSRQAFLLPRWRFDGRNPVLISRLTVDVPSAWRLRWGYWQGAQRGEFKPESRDLGKYMRLVFELKLPETVVPSPS